MATRSTIAIENADGTVTGIYCHWDGGFWHVGPTLLEHYASEGLVRELISLGDISSLGERIHPTEGSDHSFNKPEKGVTVFYGRDRGEKNIDAQTYDNWDALLRSNGQAYNYLFKPATGWIVDVGGSRGDLKPVIELENA